MNERRQKLPYPKGRGSEMLSDISWWTLAEAEVYSGEVWHSTNYCGMSVL